MAIKILEHGNRYGKIEFKCSCCGCRFTCTTDDFTIVEDYRVGSFQTTTFEMKCPECRSLLPESDGTRIEEQQKVTV